MSDPLEGARLKIERAEQHAKALFKAIEEWLENRPYTLALNTDEETGEQVCRIHIERTPPMEWSIVIGEMIHGLRSALDHAVYALSTPGGHDPPKGTEFPIFKDELMFRNANRPGGMWKIRGLSNAAQEVVASVQPFHHNGGEPERHLLWVLHQLSNADKHRSLNLIGTALGASNIRLEASGEISVVAVDLREDGPVEDGVDLVRWAVVANGPGKVQLDGDIAYDVTFDEAGPAKGESIQSSFHMMGNGVKSIVRMLAEV